MPLVLLRHRRSDHEIYEIASKLSVALPNIVSEALDVPENPAERLTSDEIEVRVSESHPCDVNNRDIEIEIIAHDYPERIQNIEERKDKIIAGIRERLKKFDAHVTGWIWIRPAQNTAFGQI